MMRGKPRARRALLSVAVLAAVAGFVPATAGARAAQHRQVDLVLPLRVDAAGLERFAVAVATPGSPLYHRYEPVAEIARRFGASAPTRRRVVAWLRAHGASHIRIDATGLLALASMERGAAERLFGGARASAASAGAGGGVPPALRGAVEGVLGLRDVALTRLSPSLDAGARTASRQPSSALARSGTPSGCMAGASAGEVGGDPSTAAFTPSQYLTAYDFDPLYQAGLFGQGQRVALIETDGVKSSDVAAFAACFGLRVPPLHVHRLGLSRPPAPGPEATLDTEVLTAAAPGLSAIDLYEVKPDVASLITALTAPLQQRGARPQVISVSLGVCEPVAKAALGQVGLVASQYALSAASSSGASVVAASGDTGSAGCQRPGHPPLDKRAVLYPASSWFVTAVGGTNLFLTAANQIADEVVWNDAGLHLGAGGGGLSQIWTRAPYQNGIVAANARALPDLSLLADVRPGYAIYCTAPGCGRRRPWLSAGGTSAATPLLAGGVALVDQALRIQNREYLGFLNPLLYSIGESAFASSLYDDVTRIGNDVGPFIPGGGGRSLGCCGAHPGFDEASGWGSVDFVEMLRLASIAQPQALGDVSARVPAGQHPVKSGRLLVRVTCSRACYAVADAAVKIGKTRFFEAVSRGFHLARAGSRTAAVAFTPDELRRLRAALAHHTPIAANAYGILTTSKYAFEKYSAPVRVTLSG